MINNSPKEIITKENNACDFSLIIPHEIHQKIMYWLTKTDKEVSGYGNLEFLTKENAYRVKDIFLLKQKVTRTSTELDPHAIGKALFKTKDEPLAMKWHWHTHPNMNVFWSMDDMEVIRSHGQREWILASVFNEKNEVRSAFYTTSEVLGKPHDVFIDELDTQIVSSFPKEFFTSLDKEYELNVSEEILPVHFNQMGDYWENGRWHKYHEQDDGGFPLLGLPSRRQNLESEKLDFDDNGFMKIADHDWLYNPAQDKHLSTDAERFEAIEFMKDWEIAVLNRRDSKFSQLLNEYMDYKAAIAESSIHQALEG